MKKRTRQKLVFWVIGSLVLSLLLAGIIHKGWFLSWHFKASNFLYYQTQNEASDDIVIVAIDDKSFQIRNASELGTLQFNKADYARVIENLETAGAKVIGIDVIFSEISPKEDQQILIETLKKYSNVIIAAQPKTDYTVGLKPLPDFIEAQPENLGAILFRTDRDNVIRRQQLLFEDDQAPDAFGLKIIKKYLGLLSEDSELTESGYQLMPFSVRVGNKKYNPTTIPLTKQNELIVNFFGQPYSFQTISFVDAYENSFIERRSKKTLDLKDKIILIGEIGTGIHDEQYVPISFGQAMPGVEINANIIQTILSQHFITEQQKGSVMLTSILILAIGLAIMLTLNVAFSILVLFAAIIFYMVTTWIIFEYGVILNTVYPYIAMVAAFITAYVYRYFTEARMVIKVGKAFSHYVSDTVVKKIMEDPDKLRLGGEKKELTVFFSDIADFTTISEKLKAENLVDQLNNYLELMGEVILKHEGTLDKYIGDAIVAFWGAPIPQSDHAARACLAALEYQKELKILRSTWKKSGLPAFYARIGINTGEMVVGNIGFHKRFDYTAIGDSVNLGARLEGVNKYYGTEILISESTYKQAKNKIEAREIDLVTVKGKTRPIRVYEPMAKKGKLTDKQKGLQKHFEKGLKAYRDQKWDKAVSSFKEALKTNPDDGPSKTYIERCKKLKTARLPKDWDGVYELKTK